MTVKIHVEEQGYVSIEREHRYLEDRHFAAQVIANIIGMIALRTQKADESADRATKQLIDELGREFERRHWIADWKGT